MGGYFKVEADDLSRELPMRLPAEVLVAALWELAEKIWPAGTEFQREITGLVPLHAQLRRTPLLRRLVAEDR
ncbi:hypothetical protein ACIPXV_02235 [Streptomyces libani]|uniref:hypothetical protein n=1 Tax=Streptomyces TaxID=1883 RepID=UPI00140EEB45|nr:hypothetical protein [Streptomyces sp. ID38640]QIK04694.1 hypothetical protein G7Z12_25640 [Streptomyces sp. ID38640]